MTRIALPLFTPSPPPLSTRVIGRLLHIANGRPPIDDDDRYLFYTMKDRILARHGVIIGTDIQRIVLKCRVCDGTGLWHYWEPHRADTCERCWGSGVYRTDFHRLERWQLAGFIFHRPIGRIDGHVDDADVTIDGKITHAPRDAQQALNAAAILAFVYSDRLFRSLFPHTTAGRVLLYLPRLAGRLWEKYGPLRCWNCGNLFLIRSRAHHWCGRCERDIPF
jgi:hypothetical protein